jgi:hypothetical protein
VAHDFFLCLVGFCKLASRFRSAKFLFVFDWLSRRFVYFVCMSRFSRLAFWWSVVGVLTGFDGLLFNVSGQLCSVLCVCGYCVLDVGFRSVIMCCLMDEWMNVYYAVVAQWLFFFSE